MFYYCCFKGSRTHSWVGKHKDPAVRQLKERRQCSESHVMYCTIYMLVFEGYTHFSCKAKCSFFKFCSEMTLLWYKAPVRGRTSLSGVFIPHILHFAVCSSFFEVSVDSLYLVWSFPSLCFSECSRPHWREDVVILLASSGTHTLSGKVLQESLHLTG